MSQVHDIYKRLQTGNGGGKHLILAELFKLVFNRALLKAEWGFFRKLLNIYGDEILFWAILASSSITERPLVYISKVCINMLKEETNREDTISSLEDETNSKLRALKSWRPANDLGKATES